MTKYFRASIVLIVLLCVSALTVQSQIFTPVKWKFSTNVLSETEAEVVATATIDAGWHVYALNASDKPDVVGPVSSMMTLTSSKDFSLAGKVSQGKYITHYDPNFEMDLNYFENTAVFRQKIKIKSQQPFKISGEILYMVCNDERCIPPDVEMFEVGITPKGAAPEHTAVDAQEAAPTTVQEGTSAPGLLNPTKWYFESNKLSEKEYELIVTAHIDEGWHIYAQTLESNEGPVPTKIAFLESPLYQPVGKTTEPTPQRKYDDGFLMNVDYHEGTPQFKQRIELNSNELPIVDGTIVYMICNNQGCIPGDDIYFKFDLKEGKAYQYDPLSGEQHISMAKDDDPFVMKSVDLKKPVSNCGKEEETHSLWMIFVFGLLGGLLALLTPCVFPMIPLTVSFFTKGSEGNKGKRRAVLYGFFILLIYFLLSLPFHLSKAVDPEVLNNISTNIWVNILFFVVFVIFAISFFGYYEIRLPSSIANKADSASEIGGLVGVFFMALTLAIVSFSCTGPILGAVLGSIHSDNGGLYSFLGLELSLPASRISAAMIGFGIGLGFPFGMFAVFPSLLKKLPKSGGWMDDFKVSLGFLELALAVKFLSNADLVQQWGIIKREVFFAVWLLIGLFWVLYLLGIFKFKPGQGTKKMSNFKLAFTIVVALFTVRLVPGVFPPSEYNRFDFLSGFPPPKFYSFYQYEQEFKLYHDLEEGLRAAAEQGKPVFLDFTGWACVNCRKMEDTVWPKDEIKGLLQSEFVMISLYVDEKVALPSEEQFVYTTKDGRKKKIETVGNKWATLQTETFNNNSQPMYAILSPNGDLLAPLEKYNADDVSYADWLKCGLEGHRIWKKTAENH